MTPKSITSKISALRWRERGLSCLWGLARLTAVVCAVILVGCLLDWIVDRFVDTPVLLRVFLLCGTISAFVLGLHFWLILPFARALTDDRLAVWVESRFPALRNRLISALQFHQPGVYRPGMSQELIDLTTKQAEEQTHGLNFNEVADHRRFFWSLGVAAATALVVAVPFLWNSELSAILVERHFRGDAEIPRNIRITPLADRERKPRNEEFAVDFLVASRNGEFPEAGKVFAAPDGKSADEYDLVPVLENDRPVTDDQGRRRYRAQLGKFEVDVAYRGYLGDGRSKADARVEMVERPMIDRAQAVNFLPDYVGLNPDGQLYTRRQKPQEISGLENTFVLLQAFAQKKIVSARLELLGPERAKKSEADEVPLVLRQTVEMKIKQLEEEGQKIQFADGFFRLADGLTKFRVYVTDELGLENVPGYEGNLSVFGEGKPTIHVIEPDYFVQNVPLEFPLASLQDSEFGEKLKARPLAPGQALRVPYLAEHAFGVGKVQFHHQYLKEKFYLNKALMETLKTNGVSQAVRDKLAPFLVDDENPEPEKIFKGKRAYLEHLAKILDAGERDEFQDRILEQARQSKSDHFAMGWRETDLGERRFTFENGKQVDFNTSYKPQAKEGRFDVRRGVFEYTPTKQKIDYYSVPALDDFANPDGLQAGGRYHFQTLVNDTAIEKVEVGDRIQYKLRAYSRNPHSIAFGESPQKEIAVQSQADYDRWEAGLNEQSAWLKKLLKGQQSVFETEDPEKK